MSEGFREIVDATTNMFFSVIVLVVLLMSSIAWIYTPMFDSFVGKDEVSNNSYVIMLVVLIVALIFAFCWYKKQFKNAIVNTSNKIMEQSRSKYRANAILYVDTLIDETNQKSFSMFLSETLTWICTIIIAMQGILFSTISIYAGQVNVVAEFD